ncbi:MAG: hypothetical protein LBN10_00890 [Propionibacteriaceae bacterium]|jgi:hypothetical protein|nr:hypothetical protein [Propionibacteriaceae bacterium]
MDALQDDANVIHVLCSDVRQITPLAEEMLSWLSDALDNLRGIGDAHARNAESDVRNAQAELRQVISAWLSDYVRRSEDLCRRITA